MESKAQKQIVRSIDKIMEKECDANTKQSPTCQLSGYDIDNISYFIAHKIPKCKKLNISLDNISQGRIISRGSFGYSFKLINKNGIAVLIKIIVCNNTKPEYIKEKEKMLKEIELHLKLTKLDKYNKYIAKIKGYFDKQEISSIFGKKSLYSYYDVETNLITCTLPSKKFLSNCEIYLFMEAGLHDLFHWFIEKFEIVTFEKITNLFFDFINCYKISEGILQLEQKIFIHTDIKPENIILLGYAKQEIKLIDFGLSLLTPTFINPNSLETIGTEYIYKILFSSESEKIYNQKLLFRSPLFDTFSIIISYFELVLYQYNKTSFRDNINILSFTEIKYKIKDLLSEKETKINAQVIEKCNRLLYLGKIIYNFYQKNIYDFLDPYLYDLDETTRLKNYFLQMEIKNLNITPINLVDPSEPIPIYDPDRDVNKTDLQKDYEYFHKIMKYCLYGNILEESII